MTGTGLCDRIASSSHCHSALWRFQMRKLMIGLTIALMVMGIINVAAHAQGTLREYTGYQVMNLATCAGCVAHVRVDYYGPTGQIVLTKNLPDIAPKASVNVQQKTEENLPDGVYS